MLTLQQLKDMEPGTIIARGEMLDIPGGLDMNNSRESLRWIAVRGGIHDWAIY